MKEFFEELLLLLSQCILVVCLAFASFLFLINFYHYKEISYSEQFDLKDNVNYQEYKKIMNNVDKKMNSVNYDLVNYSNTAKPIYEYYKTCKKDIDAGSFSALENKKSINSLDIYNANTDILRKYNGSCIFFIPYNITLINKNNKPSVSFDSTKKITDDKADIIISNSDYLIRAQLGNSSYSFVTDNVRMGVYNKTYNEMRLTINNYKLMASLLNDVADWYVDEFGGNRS